MKLLKEHWLDEEESGNLLDKVSELCYWLTKERESAKRNLEDVQGTMKSMQKDAHLMWRMRFLFYIPGDPLQAKYSAPYTIHTNLNDVDYIIDSLP